MNSRPASPACVQATFADRGWRLPLALALIIHALPAHAQTPSTSPGYGVTTPPGQPRTDATDAVAPLLLSSSHPGLARERIVLHTSAGDVVIALFAEAAPRNAAQLLTLARLGVLDTTHFWRIEPLTAVYVSRAAARQRPMSVQQKAALAPVPAEANALRLIRTAVTKSASGIADERSESLFSILMTDLPQSSDRGRFVVGFVEKGMDAIDSIAHVPHDGDGHPTIRVIESADVVDEDHIAELTLAPARSVSLSVGSGSGLTASEVRPIAGGLLLMMAIGCGAFFLANRLTRRTLLALQLINVLVGGFILLMIMTAPAQRRAWLALLVFCGVLGLIKLMSRFEAPEK